MIKIEIKNTNNFFFEGWNWKEKSIQQKPEKKIKKIKTELKIIIYDRLELKNKIKKQLQRNQEQKLEIKKLKLK
jgi:hypothetical protein